MSPFANSVVEEAALAWLEALGCAVLHGPDIAIGQPAAERADRTTATYCSKGGCAVPSAA